MAREYTVKLIEMVEDGMFDRDLLIRDLLAWMSENDVRQFVDAYGFMDEDEVEEELDDNAEVPAY